MKIKKLEAIRGAAALYVCTGHIVLGSHYKGQLSVLLKFGQEAVIVFFILSGFVIHLSNRNKITAERFSNYFLKRFTRIYTVCILTAIFIFTTTSIEQGHLNLPLPTELIGNLLMLQDFSAGKPSVICNPIFDNIPLWSLHYEWWFYMAYPLAMRIKKTTTRIHIVGILTIAGGITYALLPNPLSRLMMYFSVWWIGVCSADILVEKRTIQVRDLRSPLLYVIASATPMIFLCINHVRIKSPTIIGIHPFLEARHMISSVPLIFAAIAWRSSRWIGFQSTVGWCSFIAPISFSLYAVHYKSIAHAYYLAPLKNKPAELLLYAFITLAFCIVSELIIYPRVAASIRSLTK